VPGVSKLREAQKLAEDLNGSIGCVGQAFQPVIFFFPQGFGKEDDRLESLPHAANRNLRITSDRYLETPG
jgi:hypothetical protein